MIYSFKTSVTIDNNQVAIIVDITIRATDRDGGHEWSIDDIMLDNKPDFTSLIFESLSKEDQARIEQIASDYADENAEHAYQDYLESKADQDYDIER